MQWILRIKPHSIVVAWLFSIATFSLPTAADALDGLSQALQGGSASGNFRLRFESAEQNNGLGDAEALTARTRIAFQTTEVYGLSAMLEVEDVRIVGGLDNYTVGPTGFNPGEYSVIADPQVTEVDQAFLQYKSEAFTGRFGAQVIALDGHRHVGHVGWRQDRQTFDAVTLRMQPNKQLDLMFAYVYGRNGIFAEAADQDARDLLVNAGFTLGTGKLVAYAYLLEDDFGNDASRDTAGLSYSAKHKIGGADFSYTLEYATQSFEDKAGADFNANYTLLEMAAGIEAYSVKLGYEVLGSDDAAFGFGTPLATLHKFNGWADQFLATPAEGLQDLYATLGRKLGPGKLSVTYHDYQADEASSAKDKLGFEWNAVYAVNFSKRYNAGIKYADYNAQDHNVDAKKLWLWWGFKL